MTAPAIDSTNVLLNALATSGVNGLATVNTQVTGLASIITNYSADAPSGAGYGWLPTQTGVRSNGGNTADNQLQGTTFGTGAEFGPIDGSSAAGAGKRLFYTHIYSSQGSALNNWNNITSGYGGMLFLMSDQDPDLTANTDRTANCRGWCVGGRDTIPTLFAPTPTSFMAVDAEHTASEVLTGAATELTHIDVAATPNRFDPTSIVSGAWAWKLSGGGFIGTVSRFGYYDAYTLIEGEVAQPGTFQNFYNVTQSENHYGVAKGDSAQFRFRLAVEFGDRDLLNTQPTYFKDENVSVEFSESMQALTTPKVRVFHAGFNKIGMEEKLRAGDTFIANNIQFIGATPWHFRFASVLGADVQFNSCIIQNAGGTADDCEIGSDVLVDGGLIDGCGKLSINGGTIKDLTVSNYASTAGVDIIEASTVEDVNFASPDPVKYAIEIPDPASGTDNYTLDGVLYAGHDFDIRVLGTVGTVNISIIGGGDVPTISAGTETTNTPALLGAGWLDGTSYTAVAGGGDSLRSVVVVVSNDGNKLPDSVTFGGVTMTPLHSNLHNPLGLSMYMLIETGNTAVFTGAQTVAASWTAGTPAEVTFQFATYDHVRQLPFTPNVDQDFNSQSGGGSLAVLNDWVQGYETNNASVSVGAGSNRLLVVTEGNENNGGLAGSSGCTWGGQAMTLQVSAYGGGGPDNGTQIWTLDEAGIAAAAGTTLTFTGFAGDTPSYGAISFTGVDQTTPLRDVTSATGSNPNTSNLSAENGDILVSSFSTSPGASALTSWDNGLATPDSSFAIPPAPGTGDDPFDCARKDYSGGSTTTLQVGATGGDGTRTGWCCVSIQAGGVSAGNLVTAVATQDEGLVISAAHTESTVPFGITFGGDVTERDQVANDDRIVAVADFVDSADTGIGNATMTDSSVTAGADAQQITVHIPPARTTSGGPTVNVTANVNVTLAGMKDLTEVRVCAAGDPDTQLAGIEDAVDGTPDNRSFTFTLQAGTIVDITIFAVGYILPPNNRIDDFTIPATDTTIPISQVVDRNMLNP